MTGAEAHWVVIHMARSQQLAQKARDLLTGEGLMVRMRPVYRNVPDEENYFEILAIKSEACEARALLLDLRQDP